MKNRKLPFGYAMEQGEIVLHPAESKCVQKIFWQYQHGMSLQRITEELKKQNVPYDADKLWNKNMIARILENEHYTGKDAYPSIIEKEQFERIREIRASKNTMPQRSDAQKMLRKLCDGKVTEDVEIEVICLLNLLIQNPDMVQLPVKQEQAESGASDVVRLEKQLESLMEESTIQEQESRSVVYQLAQKACDQVDPAEYETEKIQRTLRSRTPVEQLDVHLLRTCVEKVQVFRDGQIRLILGNGQTVKRS